jgi:hypothetical protein
VTGKKTQTGMYDAVWSRVRHAESVEETVRQSSLHEQLEELLKTTAQLRDESMG